MRFSSPRKTSIIFEKHFLKKKLYIFSWAAECLKEYTYGEYLTVLLFTRCCFTIKKEVAFIIKFIIFHSKLLQLGTWWQNATAGHSKLSHWDSLSQYLTSVWVLSSLLYWACYSNKVLCVNKLRQQVTYCRIDIDILFIILL